LAGTEAPADPARLQPSGPASSASSVIPLRARPYPPEIPIDKSAPSLKIAFISYANPQQVVKDSEPIVAYLKRFVGLEVEGLVTTDYGASIEAMRSEKADVAFVDPLAFMMAHEQIGTKPLLLEVYYGGKPTYHSSIWVHKDSGIRAVSDLKGKTIAFADQVDMSGHLLPREIFVRQGLVGATLVEGEFFKQTYFAGGDEQAIRAVLNRFVDAAGVSQYAELLLRPEERAQVTAIANSIESPSHLVMVREGLSAAVSDRIKSALLALDYSDPADQRILDKLYGVQGYVAAKLSDFAEVAKVAARYGFVKKPDVFAADESR
jgi:phosphonate transport system substrate-binding protein